MDHGKHESAEHDSDDALVAKPATAIMMAVNATGVLKDADDAIIAHATSIVHRELRALLKGEDAYRDILKDVADGTIQGSNGDAEQQASARCSARRRRSPLRPRGRPTDNRIAARDGIPGRNATACRHRRWTGICPHPNAAAARTGTSDCDAARPEGDGAGRNDRLKKRAGHDGQRA